MDTAEAGLGPSAEVWEDAMTEEEMVSGGAPEILTDAPTSPEQAAEMGVPHKRHTSNMLEENQHSLPDPEELKVDSPTAASTTSTIASAFFQKRDKKTWIGIASLVVLVLVLIIALSVRVSNKNNEGSSSSIVGDPSREQEVIEFLSQVSPREVLESRFGPQATAAKWIAVNDGRQLEVPESIEDEDAFHFLQRYALAVMYFALRGGEWVFKHHFLSDKDVCQWSDFFKAGTTDFHVGVGCNDEGRVSTLFLPSNRLTGPIPPEFGLLTSLEHVSMFDNAISGVLPKEMRELTNLNFLAMESNMISGMVPDWFGNLDRLEFLALGDNIMTGTLPDSLDGMEGLIQVSLEMNELEGSIDVLNSIPNVDALYLSENKFTGTLDESFLKALNLKILDLSSNQFDGVVPRYFFEDSLLEVLDLHNNTLTGIPEVIEGTNTRMTFLALHHNGIAGTIPSSLSKLVELQHLDLSLNGFMGDIPDFLSQMSRLTYLFLAGNQFNKGEIPDFSALTGLRELSLKRTVRSGTIPAYLSTLRDLVLLDLHHNELTGNLPDKLPDKLQFLLLNRNDLEGTVPASYGDLENLSVVLLDQNDLSGSMDVFCPRRDALEVLVADCGGENPRITCDDDCCTLCCADVYCNDEDWLANFDGNYENGFDRDTFVFSENIEFVPRDEK